jgi:hypothetical protein
MTYIADFYKLDNTFDEIEARLTKKHLFKVYPELKNEFGYYKTFLEKSSPLPIDAKKFPIQRPIVNLDNVHSCASTLDLQKLDKFKSIPKVEYPIVLAYHSPINKLIIIDGNHRYHTAIARKDTHINAVCLSSLGHTSFMASDLSKHCYLIHHNLILLQKLCVMPLSGKFRLSKSLGIDDYYPISNLHFDFTSRRNIELN